MRDVNRIDKIMDKMKTIGKQGGTDMRLGQFLANLLSSVCAEYKLSDLGYVEDQEAIGDIPSWETILDNFIEKKCKSK